MCTEAILVKTFEKKNKALIAQDTFALSLLASTKLAFTHSNGWIEDYKSFTSGGAIKGLFYNDIRIDSLKSIKTGQTGLLLGTGTFDIWYKNNALILKLSFTETYTCDDNEWKILARHSSKL